MATRVLRVCVISGFPFFLHHPRCQRRTGDPACPVGRQARLPVLHFSSGGNEGDTNRVFDVFHGSGSVTKTPARYARVRRRAGLGPAAWWTRRANAGAAAGVRKATKIVSSPPIVPRTSSIGAESMALASGCAAAGGVLITTMFTAASAKTTE